jgi:7tm Odorant receptor
MFLTYIELFKNPQNLLKAFEIRLNKKLSKCQIVMSTIFHSLFIGTFIILQTIELFRVKNASGIATILGILPIYVGACIKTVNFLSKKDQIISSLKLLKEIAVYKSWIAKQNGTKLDKRIAQTNKICKGVFCTVFACCIFCCFDPIFFNELLYKMWYPFEYKKYSLTFWGLTIYQLINCFVYSPLVCIYDMFSLFLISYAVGFTEELSDRMAAVTNNEIIKVKPKPGNKKSKQVIKVNDDCHLQELRECFEIQLKIKEYVQTITNNFGKIFWMQGFLSTWTLCTISFSLTTVSNVRKN